jgi:hypothetical protein
MSDQKNKQQQPQQGNKQSGQVPGQQPQQGNKQSGRVPSQDGNMKNSKQSEDIEEGDIEHPDQQPDKKVKIGDNPDETQKKVPNMHSKH